MLSRPLPETPYVVAQRHSRPVGNDCLVAFAGNLYSVPDREVRDRQLIEVRATKSQVILHPTIPDDGSTLLAAHRERSAKVPTPSTRCTGKGRRTARTVVSPPATSCLAPPGGVPGHRSRTAAVPCLPGPQRPTFRSDAVRLPSMTS